MIAVPIGLFYFPPGMLLYIAFFKRTWLFAFVNKICFNPNSLQNVKNIFTFAISTS